MKADQNDFRRLMIQAEIAALLHDIGKFSYGFLKGGEYRLGHTENFFSEDRNHCEPALRKLLDTPLPENCLKTPDGNRQIKTLGELARWHHWTSGYKKHFGVDKGEPALLPMLLFLISYADTTDSAATKGGASFDTSKENRQSRLQGGFNEQDTATIYLARPFGEEERPLHDQGEFSEKQITEASHVFHRELAAVLRTFFEEFNDLAALVRIRQNLRACLEKHLSDVLAETRLPNNDVSLWQHSDSTTAIFKAMLARHLLEEDYEYCDAKGNMVYHREKTAIFGVCWNEDSFTGRSFRPAEILGRRKRLDDCAEHIKTKVETEFCLGNEIYRNRDGIYFLVPDKSNIKKQVARQIDALVQSIDPLINGEKSLGGELQWEARYLPLGLQVTRLAEIIEGGTDVEVLGGGPVAPPWMRSWQGVQGKEICPRCGLRPVTLKGVVVGSQGDDPHEDDDAICLPCRKYSETGGRFRREAKEAQTADPQVRRLLAVDASCKYYEDDLSKFFEGSSETERRRLVLVQGVFDLRPVFSGTAFSSILGYSPERFTSDPQSDDQSCEMDTWDRMLQGCSAAWQEVSHAGQATNRAVHTLQQIFQDSFLFSKKDGRAAGDTLLERGLGYLKDSVLQTPFTAHLTSDAAKLVNHALRQHPAPSRLARVWQTTLDFNRQAVAWCEGRAVKYAPVNLDPGRFTLLMPAKNAWEFLHSLHERYAKRFGRVRHLLPLHLSATVFYHKAPLYIAVDAARRFAELAMQRSAETRWMEVADISDTHLRLKDDSGRTFSWERPGPLPNGKPDIYYSWYWIEGVADHPVALADLRPGMKIAVYPSTFDYEILDATSRRYDIRWADTQKSGRPHLFKKGAGPRPYPLEQLADWRRLDGPLGKVETSQRKHLIEMLAALHQGWQGGAFNGRYAQDLANLAEDALKNTLSKDIYKNEGADLHAMAQDGSLFDLFEWQDFINS